MEFFMSIPMPYRDMIFFVGSMFVIMFGTFAVLRLCDWLFKLDLF